VLSDLAGRALSGGDLAVPSFKIPSFEIKLAVLRSNCRNRLKISDMGNVEANAEGNYRWVLAWRFKGGINTDGGGGGGSSTSGGGGDSSSSSGGFEAGPSGGTAYASQGTGTATGGSGEKCSALSPCSSGTCKNTEGWSLCVLPVFGKCQCV